jgi:hypothetical protein
VIITAVQDLLSGVPVAQEKISRAGIAGQNMFLSFLNAKESGTGF